MDILIFIFIVMPIGFFLLNVMASIIVAFIQGFFNLFKRDR